MIGITTVDGPAIVVVWTVSVAPIRTLRGIVKLGAKILSVAASKTNWDAGSGRESCGSPDVMVTSKTRTSKHAALPMVQETFATYALTFWELTVTSSAESICTAGQNPKEV